MADFVADFELQENKAIEAEFIIDNLIESYHNLLSNRDLPDQHPISAITGLQEALDTETEGLQEEKQARQEADEVLQQNIEKEESARISADETLQNNIDSESNRAQTAESLLITDLDSEITRAKDAESALKENINAEATARTDADAAIDEKIGTETSRATTAEESLQSAINAEQSRSESAESQLSDAITAENTRAKAAETNLSNAITAEKTRAESAESILQNNIDSEASARASDITRVEGLISDEENRATTAESTIAGNLSAEISRATNAENTISGNLTAETERATAAEEANATSISNHIADKDNPHEVTKAQVGLGNVDNTSDANKPVSTAQQNAINAVDTKVETHIADMNNPHSVTKVQIGLGNVDNTSDLDKPISTAVSNAFDAVEEEINDINSLIPSAAGSSNQLADKSFVNSSISTNTANFIGTFNSVEELEAYSGTLTNNDYAFVISTDSSGNTVYNRYKWNGSEWLFEYSLNNSSFTASQWAAINSGATSESISQIDTNAGNITTLSQTKQDNITSSNMLDADLVDDSTSTNKFVTTSEKSTWNAKQNAISDLAAIRAGAQAGATALQSGDNVSELTNDAGYITGINASDVTSALGYTPYNAANPSGYQENVLEGIQVNGTDQTITDKKVNITVPTQASDVGAVSANTAITGATKCKISYDSKGLVTAGANLAASDIPNLPLSKITDVTASATELNYTDGVTSNIQTQLNAKANDNAVVKLTGNQTVSGTKTFNNEVVVNDASIYLKNTDGANTSISPRGSIELTPLTNQTFGGFIDFHYAGSLTDNTSRIIEDASGQININGAKFPKTAPSSVPVQPTDDNTSSTQIDTVGARNTKLQNYALASSIPTVDQTYSGTSTNAQSGVAVKSAIDTAISSTYKPAGSVAFASLPTLAKAVEGNVYNVSDAFTTTADFVEGAGKSYPAGTNVVCINTATSGTAVYKWDVLSGFVDLSGYVPTSRTVNGKALSANVTLSGGDITNNVYYDGRPSVPYDLINQPMNTVIHTEGSGWTNSPINPASSSSAGTSLKIGKSDDLKDWLRGFYLYGQWNNAPNFYFGTRAIGTASNPATSINWYKIPFCNTANRFSATQYFLGGLSTKDPVINRQYEDASSVEGGEINFEGGLGEPNANKVMKIDRYSGSFRFFGQNSSGTVYVPLVVSIENNTVTVPTPTTSDNSNKVATTAYVKNNLSSYQPTLVSGTNIKTVNGTSLLGSGNVTVTANSSWGNITGTLSDQTDLNTALSGKVSTTDLAPCHVVVETYVNGTEWYRVYDDGWVEQGGWLARTGTGILDVTLLKPFSNLNYSVQATNKAADSYTSASTFYPPYILNCTTTGFSMSSNANINNIAYFVWEAKGF